MEPKYKIGDIVWMVNSHKAEQFTITAIRKLNSGGFAYSTQTPKGMYENININNKEEDIFATKEELLKSL